MKLHKLSHVGIFCLNIFIVAYWYVAFDGFYFYDDLTYAKNALQLVKGNFSFPDHLFSQRLTIIGATAVSYLLFGIGDYATILPPLICTLVTCNAIYFFLLKKSFFVAIMAASVYAFDFYTIFFSKVLYPDVLLSCFVFLGLVTLFFARQSSDNVGLRAFGVVFSFFLAFVSKLTILFVFPFLLSVFGYDLTKQKNIKFWCYTIILSICAGGIYLWWQHQAFGNYFYRFNTIVGEGHYVSNGSYFDKNWYILLKRMTYQPLIMFLNSSMIIPLGLSFPVLIGYRDGKLWNHDAFEKFWAYAGLSILLYFWWGSTSWQYYNPIALFPRHILLLIPPLAILSGCGLSRMRELSGFYLLIFAIISMLGLLLMTGKILIIYVLLLCVFVLFWKFRNKEKAGIGETVLNKTLLFLALVVILSVHPVYSMFKPSVSGYFNLNDVVTELHHEKEEGEILIITDEQIADKCEYVFRYWECLPSCFSYSNVANVASLSEFDQVFILKYDFHRPIYKKTYLVFKQRIERWGMQLNSFLSTGNAHVLEIGPVTNATSED